VASLGGSTSLVSQLVPDLTEWAKEGDFTSDILQKWYVLVLIVNTGLRERPASSITQHLQVPSLPWLMILFPSPAPAATEYTPAVPA